MAEKVLEPKTESQEEKNGGLTLEEIQKAVTEDDLNQLSDEKQKEFHDRFVVGDEEIPEPVKPGEEPPKAEEQKVDQPKTENEKEKPTEPLDEDNIKRLREKYYLKSNELNEARQKLENTNKRLEEIKNKNFEAPKVSKDDDVYSEEYVKNFEARQKALEDKFVARDKKDELSLREEKSKLELQTDLLEIAQLQIENASLQTEKPFSALNAAYSRFQTVIGGPENREKFLNEPEYRKQMEDRGHIFPMSEPDWKRYKELLEIRSFKLEKFHPDLDSAYYKWRKEHGIIPDSVQEASLEATQKATTSIANSSQETTVLPPNAGTMSNTSTGWTKETIEAWINANPTPKTPEERKTMYEIKDILQRGLI